MSFWRGREGYRNEVREEIRLHLELRVRELRKRGMDADEAWRQALESFGDPSEIEREVLEMRENRKNLRPIGEVVTSLTQDVRYAARFLTRNRIFALVAIGTLALGIGANTAIFSLVDAALLQAPPIRDPGSVVALYTSSSEGRPRSQSSYLDYIDYRDLSTQLEDVAATTVLLSVSLGDDELGAVPVTVGAATGNYFPLLGLEAALGRLIQPADDRFGSGAPVAVLSHGLWQDRLGADPDVIGRSIRLNGLSFEVVGVLPEEYRGLSLREDPALWIPLQSSPALDFYASLYGPSWDERGSRGLQMLVGRIAPGSTVERVRTEMSGIAERLNEAYPEERGALVDRYVTVDPLERYLLPGGSESALPRFLWLLVGVVGATLLLACANLANLLLARASARKGEIGIRIAIGAGRGRLVRQLLVESVFLSTLGGAAGLLVAFGLLRLIGAYELPGGVTISVLGAGLDGRVLGVAAGLSLLTVAIFGLVPALQATRAGAARGLHRGGSAELERGSGTLRRGLVAVQVALCFILLAGSGLFVRTLQSALAADLGFRPGGVAMGQISASVLELGRDEGFLFTETLRERLEARPVVRSAAVAGEVPFQGGYARRSVEIEGYQRAPDESMELNFTPVSLGYLETLGIPLLEGRAFAEADDAGAVPVAIVNRTMAERYWPGGEALGGTIRMSGTELRVVGIVEDVHWSAIDEAPRSTIFTPLAQAPERTFGTFLTIVARGDGDAAPLLSAIRGEVRAVDPDLTFRTLTTLDDLIGEVLMPQRMGAVLLSAFGLLALVLAAVGIVGVVTYTVREQRRAIGVRMALGAGRNQVVRLVLRGMLAPVALGLAVGVGGALVVDDSVQSFLFGVSAGDPLTYGTIAAGLAAVALVATLIPAREATRVDPLRVLRAE